jgi:hypothetical protein
MALIQFLYNVNLVIASAASRLRTAGCGMAIVGMEIENIGVDFASHSLNLAADF